MSGNVGKIAAERNQKALMELAMRPGNGECRLNSICRLWTLFAPPAWPRDDLRWRRRSSHFLTGQRLPSKDRRPQTPSPRVTDVVLFPSQIFVRIVRHEIRDGPPTTLGYSFGM